ncbi:MAG: hypothetical protein ABIR94_03835 [Rubrivivax sp.]
MTALLTELKTRARLRLNASRREQPDARLRHCLIQVAQDVGFAHWEHGRRVLGGMATEGDDVGAFWHAPRCNSLLSNWFALHAEARIALNASRRSVLLPYRRQFVVVQGDYIRELGLDADHPAWVDAQRDLVRAYGGASWLALGLLRLKAPRSTFAAPSRTTRGI